ncbi:MAG: hypothetical protein HUJ51_05200 [Eggerthellaceae bacterium]|nr:hypothetical protein [Eggerthellaceae bacterium]
MDNNMNLAITSAGGLSDCVIKSDFHVANFFVGNNSSATMNLNFIQIKKNDTSSGPLIYVENGSTVNIGESTNLFGYISRFAGAAFCIKYRNVNILVSEIYNNTPSSYSRGGIAGLFDKNIDAFFNMISGSIHGNQAAENCCGTCIENGRVDFSAKLVVSQDTSDANRGFNVHTGDKFIYFTVGLDSEAKICIVRNFYKECKKFSKKNSGKTLVNLSPQRYGKDIELMGYRGDNLFDIASSNEVDLCRGPDPISMSSPEDDGGQSTDNSDSYLLSLVGSSYPVFHLMLVLCLRGLLSLGFKLHIISNKN